MYLILKVYVFTPHRCTDYIDHLICDNKFALYRYFSFQFCAIRDRVNIDLCVSMTSCRQARQIKAPDPVHMTRVLAGDI